MSLHVWFHLSEPLPVWCSELWGRKRSIGLFCLQTLICTGKQDQLPDDTVTFSLSTLPVCLTGSVSIFVYPHFSLRECKKVLSLCLLQLCLHSSPLSGPLSYPSLHVLFCLLSDHLCPCVCSRPFPSRT